MSRHASSDTAPGESTTLETGIEALRSSGEFRHSVEQLDGHNCNDHFAHIYEKREEKFAAAVPFIRRGLERGERVMYVVDESTEAEAKNAMLDAGIDVDAAVESGELSFHTVQETYLRTGSFDVDEMIEFYDETVTKATEEHAAFRIVAEMTWIRDADTSVEEFMEYEQKVNGLFDETDSLAICQYNRELFAPEVIRRVVQTHPNLIYDGAACHNVYYIPPEEFFGDNAAAHENERMLRTLRDRAAARSELQYRERFLRESYQITSDPTRSFEEKLQALFELGCDRFDLDLGGLAKVDPDSDRFELEHVSGEHDHLVPGARLDLSDTYCRVFADRGDDPGDDVSQPVAVTDPDENGFADAACLDEFGIHAYFGVHISIADGHDRTLFFVAEAVRDEEFSEAERTFQRLLGQWIRYELERQQREQELRERTEHLNALVETTPECIKTVGADGTLLQMNPAGLDMVEADSAADVVGECVYDLIAPEHRQAFREFNERICRGERGTLEFDIVGLSGTRRHMETHAAPLCRPDGAFAHVALTRDVTERKEREAELRQTKNRFETVFEQSDDGIFILSPSEDEIVDANPAAAEMTGYARAELSSLNASDLHPDETSRFRAFLDEVQETGSAWSEDFHCRHKDGHDIPAEITASAITLDGRSLVLALVRDVSERKTHERYQRELYEVTADPALGFEAKVERLLELGRDRFGLEIGGLNHLPSWDGKFRLEKGVGLGVAPDEEVWTDPGDDCYCRRVVAEEEPVEMTDVRGTRWSEDAIYREFGVTCYFGTKVMSGSTPYGTLWFGSTEPRRESFSDAERSFIELMSQWIGYEIERRKHNDAQRELYEIIADTDLATDEKIDRLLDVGCDRLDLAMGMVTRQRESAFEIEQMHGTHPDLGEGTLTPPLTDNYCRRVVDVGESVSVADAGAAGWDGDALYHEFGLECYAGTPVTIGGDAYGTVCFTDTSPREEFTEAERAFLDLLGQCVGYELEQTHREARMHALNAVGRELMGAETAADVAAGVVESIEDAFDRPVVAVALYDDETGELRPAAGTDAAELVGAASLFDDTSGVGWEAFVEGEPKRVTDPFERADVDASEPPSVPEAVVHPLGTHGVHLVGARGANGFRDGDAEVIETCAANIRAALDRVDRERQLQDREEALEEQNETLSRLNRINDTIRGIDQALVEAGSRKEVERVVCEELAVSGPYELAWIGDYDGVTGEVSASESAGAEKGYLDAVSIRADDTPEGNGPTGQAIRTGEPQVINNVLTDASFEPWRQEALNRGYQSTAAFPLEYDGTRYGVLNLYARQPAVFDDLERDVLNELSNTIAHTINAIESKKALVGDEVTELEFTVEDSAFGVVSLVEETGCELRHESLVPRADGGIQIFFSTRGAPADEILEFAACHDETSDFDLISEYEEGGERVCLFEAEATDESITKTMVDHGGNLQYIHARDGTATVTVHVAADADIRTFVEMFTSQYADSELTAQRTRERSDQTLTGFTAALTEALTDRQLEVLQTAYFSGYFEEPRTRTASEIADTMDIAQPTFNSHLRAGMRKLYERLFEDASAVE